MLAGVSAATIGRMRSGTPGPFVGCGRLTEFGRRRYLEVRYDDLIELDAPEANRRNDCDVIALPFAGVDKRMTLAEMRTGRAAGRTPLRAAIDPSGSSRRAITTPAS
jgi:hypothetical protein